MSDLDQLIDLWYEFTNPSQPHSHRCKVQRNKIQFEHVTIVKAHQVAIAYMIKRNKRVKN